ncbi:MAG: isopentenyl-diphosphate Delta-isomerase [Syntrophotaleaceae bacterium]
MEQLILVDADGGVIGFDSKDSCHQGMGKLHLAFSILIFTTDGQLLLQKRSSQKMLWPLYWSNSVCSHPRKGEDIEEAASRRIKEELGICCHVHYLYTFKYHASYFDIGSESEICSVFFGIYDGPVFPEKLEVEQTKYVHFDCLADEIEKSPDSFTPWFKMEWDLILRQHMGQIKKFLGSFSNEPTTKKISDSSFK